MPSPSLFIRLVRSLFDRILRIIHILADVRISTFALLSFVILLCLVPFDEITFFGGALVVFTLMHIAMTLIAVNSLYDRYYSPTESLEWICLGFSLGILTQISKDKKRVFLFLLIFIPLLIGAISSLAFKIPLSSPLGWDSPILGQTAQGLIEIHRYVLGWFLTSLLVTLIVIPLFVFLRRRFPK